MKHGGQVHRLLDGLEGLATRSCGAKLTGGQIRLWAGQVRNLGALVCAERGPVNIDDAVDAHLTARGLWEPTPTLAGGGSGHPDGHERGAPVQFRAGT